MAGKTIIITPSEVKAVSAKFTGAKSDMDLIVTNSKTTMNNLRPTFKGHTADRIFEEWDAYQKPLKDALDTLEQCSKILKEAAEKFENVDN